MDICEKLHEVVNDEKKFKRYYFKEKDIQKIPEKSGIYIMFEKGEEAHNGNRIVRVGISKNLKKRLRGNHYKGKHDTSTFRRWIGDALLGQKDPDNYRDIWNIKGKKKNRKNKGYNKKAEEKIEERITKYLEDKISFIIIQIDDEEDYKKYEKKLIATIASCQHCKQSNNWLGKKSSNDKIKNKNSSLWNPKEMSETIEPFTEEEFETFIEKYIK